MYLGVCLNTHGTPQARRRLQISGEWNLGYLEEPRVLLTAEPSLFLNVTVSCAVCAVCCLVAAVGSAVLQREVSEARGWNREMSSFLPILSVAPSRLLHG